MNYRIYGYNDNWEYITTIYEEEQLEEYIDNLSGYRNIMVIRYNISLNQDENYYIKSVCDSLTRRLK